jgi:hypothetical protein
MMGHYPPHMMWNCCTPVRVCHKEFKELLVTPEAAQTSDTGGIVLQPNETGSLATGMRINPNTEVVRPTNEKATSGKATAIIGGGCCVHLAVEYMPDPAVSDAGTNGRGVRVRVLDSDNSQLMWTKEFTDGYHVKENIITTKPGATLSVNVTNAIARVRGAEIYSG